MEQLRLLFSKFFGPFCVSTSDTEVSSAEASEQNQYVHISKDREPCSTIYLYGSLVKSEETLLTYILESVLTDICTNTIVPWL